MEPQNTASDGRSIEVRLKACELSLEVKALREQHRKQDVQLEGVVKPRAEAQIAACRIAANDLRKWHQAIADTTDLELDGYSRGAAVWLLAGRCLGLHQVLIVQAEARIDNEGLVAGRALHEANTILLALLANPDEENLVRQWLDDDGKHGYVKQKAAREAQSRFENEVNEAMEEAGMVPGGTTDELRSELYDRMSRTAHNRRSSCVSSLWLEGREMSYGRAPNVLRWAEAVEWTSAMTVELVHTVGDALRAFSGDDFLRKKIAPLVQSINAVRETASLDEKAIWQAVVNQDTRLADSHPHQRRPRSI